MTEPLLTIAFQWVVLGIVTERTTEILVDSKISEDLFRRRLKEAAHPLLAEGQEPPPPTFRRKALIFLDHLLSCGYCTSVWVGFLFALVAPNAVALACPDSGCFLKLYNWVVNWLVVGLLIHGEANFFHVVFMLVKKGRVKTHDLMIQFPLPLEVKHEVNDGRRRPGESAGERTSEAL